MLGTVRLQLLDLSVPFVTYYVPYRTLFRPGAVCDAGKPVGFNYRYSKHCRNPIPGKIYSTPEKTRDVREGVKIDYRGADVNPKNILAVLSGNKSAVNGGNGRVLER